MLTQWHLVVPQKNQCRPELDPKQSIQVFVWLKFFKLCVENFAHFLMIFIAKQLKISINPTILKQKKINKICIAPQVITIFKIVNSNSPFVFPGGSTRHSEIEKILNIQIKSSFILFIFLRLPKQCSMGVELKVGYI